MQPEVVGLLKMTVHAYLAQGEVAVGLLKMTVHAYLAQGKVAARSCWLAKGGPYMHT